MLEKHGGYGIYLGIRALFGLGCLAVLASGDVFAGTTWLRLAVVAVAGFAVDVVMRASMYSDFRRAIEEARERDRRAHEELMQAYMDARRRDAERH